MARLKWHFVYAPRSGPRWIGEADPREDLKVPCVVWPNESAHVFGQKLSFDASYWRPEARKAAGAIALRLGGVAWDDHGTVSLVLPIFDCSQAVFVVAALWYVRAAATGDMPSHAALKGMFVAWDEDIYLAQQAWDEAAIHALFDDWNPVLLPVSVEVAQDERGTTFRARLADQVYEGQAPWHPARVFWGNTNPSKEGG